MARESDTVKLGRLSRSRISAPLAKLETPKRCTKMVLGPMAHVAALRETSVLFGALMGTLLLGESFGVRRVAAALVIVSGLVLMNGPALF